MTLLSNAKVFLNSRKERTSAPSAQFYSNETSITSDKCFFAKFVKYLIQFSVNQRHFSCSFIVKPYAHVITAIWLIIITCRKG